MITFCFSKLNAECIFSLSPVFSNCNSLSGSLIVEHSYYYTNVSVGSFEIKSIFQRNFRLLLIYLRLVNCIQRWCSCLFFQFPRSSKSTFISYKIIIAAYLIISNCLSLAFTNISHVLTFTMTSSPPAEADHSTNWSLSLAHHFVTRKVT